MSFSQVVRLALLAAFITASAQANTPEARQTACSCGYYDPSTESMYTDSVIVYFNETTAWPSDFVVDEYEHHWEKGWNNNFRGGSNITNVQIGREGSNQTSLELFIDPARPDHLVMGADVRTQRQDLHWGSFRTSLRSPRQTNPGSGLSMMLTYNLTETTEIDVMNTNSNTTAWVSMLSHTEFPDPTLGVTYANLTSLTGQSPWDFVEYRIDWTEKETVYYIAGQPFRTVLRKHDSKLPSTPSALHLLHWSYGNEYTTQGPPNYRGVANVGWVRLFFNSSTTTQEQQLDFDARCAVSDACAVDDNTLRQSSSYTEASTVQWQQVNHGRRNIPALIITIISGCVSGILLLNAIFRRLPNPFARYQKSEPSSESEPNSKKTSCDDDSLKPKEKSPASPLLTLPSMTDFLPPRLSSGGYSSASASGTSTPAVHELEAEIHPKSGHHTLHVPHLHMPHPTVTISHAHRPSLPTIQSMSSGEVPGLLAPDAHGGFRQSYNSSAETISVEKSEVVETVPDEKESMINEKGKAHATVVPVPDKSADTNIAAPRLRIEYLAGLVALCTLFVTATHFCLTFVPMSIDPDSFEHYGSETIARKTIDSFMMNSIWIGSFLTTSPRFLIMSYLRKGDLKGMAEKIVSRPFRLIVPIVAVSLMEYFFMDCGATNWLEYLPSVTWSSWPFVTLPPTFGNWVSLILELAYMIPNAAPRITYNFCTGVLWTIPVQLQGSWLIILGIIMIREMKTPWKRFGFYALAILCHYYVQSWGSYFYLGMLVTDLDITYKWRPWLHARPRYYYSLIGTCWLLGIAAPCMFFASNFENTQYATFEYGIHPDIPTGLSQLQAGTAIYPPYTVPKGNGVVFSTCLQVIVELSPIVQGFFSLAPFRWIFPHIFSIYLIHGFILWSLGATVAIMLSTVSWLPYWANMCITAACYYVTLFACLPILTPVVESLGKDVTGHLWEFAHEVPAPRRPTLYPFRLDLITNRGTTAVDDEINKHVKKSIEHNRAAFVRDIDDVSGDGPIDDHRRVSKEMQHMAHERRSSRDITDVGLEMSLQRTNSISRPNPISGTAPSFSFAGARQQLSKLKHKFTHTTADKEIDREARVRASLIPSVASHGNPYSKTFDGNNGRYSGATLLGAGDRNTMMNQGARFSGATLLGMSASGTATPSPPEDDITPAVQGHRHRRSVARIDSL